LALDRVVVALDMDSTLITIECVDEIADRMGIAVRWPRSPRPRCEARSIS
jgi:hypothetical protein